MPKKEKTAGIVTLNMPGLMSRAGRAQISQWLHELADELTVDGDQWPRGRFRARFLYKTGGYVGRFTN